MHGAALFRNVTWRLRHVLMSWNGPFQGLTPAGSGRLVREGSTTLFTNHDRNALPGRRCGERASLKLTMPLAATMTSSCPCPWSWTWAWHAQPAMRNAWYGGAQPLFPVPHVRTYKTCICIRLQLTSKSESDSGNTMSGLTIIGGGEEIAAGWSCGGRCSFTAEDGPLPSISIEAIFDTAFFLPFAISAIRRRRLGPAVPFSLWHFFRRPGSDATYASGTSISGSNTAVTSDAC